MRRVLFASLFLFGAQYVWAQTTVQVQKAQLSIPFGSVTGSLVLAGDMLVFIDDTNPEASFAASRADITEVRTEGEAVVVDLRRPVRDRTGERNRVSFRMMQGGATGVLADWWRRTPNATGGGTAPVVPVSTSADAGALTLPVRHDHRVGGCTGRLIIGEDRINYESLSEVAHSRQWNLRDIKEIKRKNPYHLEIDSFGEDDYNFDLQGKTLDTADYQKLVDRIAAARAKR